jgi:hypothetical protein
MAPQSGLSARAHGTGQRSWLSEVNIMVNESTDSQILAREQWAIELLARETHTAIATAQEVSLVEYKRLAAHARIKAYLPLLTCNSVRGTLDLLNAGKASVPQA